MKEAMGKISRWDLEWSFQTYHKLKERNNIQVSLSNSFDRNSINIIHSASLLKVRGSGHDFIVCIRADFPHRDWAQYHIVQNKNQITADSSFLPFWIQPNLTKRNAKRTSVDVVAYTGQIFNGNLAGSPTMWEDLLKPYKMRFCAIKEEFWGNLRDVDILIGIRSFDKRPYNSKPPSKMLNAWHADIPFIGGYDSAFLQFGVPGQDYLRVSSTEEALQAILRLRNEPELYNKLVEHGQRKATLYNNETIADQWEDELLGPVVERYERWKARPVLEKISFTRKLNLSLLNHHSKQIIKLFYKTGQ
jgi:hypothetical protein